MRPTPSSPRRRGGGRVEGPALHRVRPTMPVPAGFAGSPRGAVLRLLRPDRPLVAPLPQRSRSVSPGWARNQGDGIRVVRQPFVDGDDLLAGHLQHPAPIGQLGGPGDHPLGAHLRSLVATSDLGATFDQDHAKATIAVETVLHEGSIPGFEDVERDHGMRKEDGAEREHREPAASHVPPWHVRNPKDERRTGLRPVLPTLVINLYAIPWLQPAAL